MAWTIDFDDKAIKNLQKIGKTEAARIRDFLHTRIKPIDNPRQLGRALEGQKFNHLWRYRVGDYRIICDIQDQKLVVLVVEIGHRREIYR
ncbi:type II toxin-antitoxin system mRNA interferase toxin, RelE/StbE family [Metarhizobium album]|uniref:Type II toxin-antitoxin system mRNA interferase toxin, RelE/StbE family n=1 Tax=Metarhizobium album TaxID=2182425 RepID=A0A2U2DXB0_9HYPH|nr:type II toxin-antitoxin system RelE/ParE family toxin [Rhizobium album]PWE57950.1 type II toxin-antitoxin system mRNA interferase toxin, RelE/StbE family [Rhizobium album]